MSVAIDLFSRLESDTWWLYNRDYNSESRDCRNRDCYPTLKICWREGRGRGDWKLLKKMEMKVREKDESVTSRAKVKTERVTGARTGAASDSGAAQGAKDYHSCPGHPEAQ